MTEAPVGAVAQTGMKFTGLLLDYVAPIGAFLAGYGAGDIMGLETMLTSFLPRAATASNSLVKVPTLLTAAVYFALGYLISRYIPYVGRIVFGFLAGCGLRTLFKSFGSGTLGQLAPAGA